MANTGAGASARTKVGDLTLEYLGKMQGSGSQTIARMLRKDHPRVFATVQHARSAVAYYRGTSGKRKRGKLAVRDFILPEPTEGNPFSLPESREKPWLPYILGPDCERNAVIADWHIPYHNMVACNVMLQAMKEFDPDCIILNGDMWDCYSISRFGKNPEERDFKRERRAMRQFLAALRTAFPGTKIIYKEGNHELRFMSLLENKAPDLLGLEEFRVDVLLGLCDLGIDWIAEKRIIKCGKLNVLHGHEWMGGASVNPARAAFNKGKACSLSAHNHQSSQHSEPTLDDISISCWSMGCGCELHPLYMPINKWNHGMAFVTRYGDDDFRVDNKRVIKGELV